MRMIGVPTVIHGCNFEFRHASGLTGTSIAFTGGEERFEVRVALAPSPGHGSVHSGIPVLGLAHI